MQPPLMSNQNSSNSISANPTSNLASQLYTTEARSVNDLAIFGGAPAFDEKLYVGRPNIGDRERFIERVNDILDRKWLSNDGPYVKEFERRIEDLIGVKHCIAICNGTVALELAIRGLDLRGEVIMPSFTFTATAHALQWQEITPVFCDINPRTHNIDPHQVETMITPRTTGIIGVHVWGTACDIDNLTKISNNYNLKLIFDAAHAFGCSYQGRMIGNFGNAEVFSFHATKFLNTLEGGAIVTNDDELAAKIRLMRNFGFSGYDQVIYIGTNGKMDEMSAAMGVTGLESMEEFIATNYSNYKQYQRELVDVPGIYLFQHSETKKHNYQYIVIEIDETATNISRDQLIDVLWAENIIARKYFYPGCHRMEPYRSYFPHAGLLLHETEALSKRVIVLPTGTSIGPVEISKICQIIRLAVSNGHLIKERLANHFKL
jgi:dTDP-4-amino-4,6-dideoxygalactose transaminase